MCIFPNSQYRFIETHFLKMTGHKVLYRQKMSLTSARCKHNEFWGFTAIYVQKISGQLLK